jgi:hypothetical protein
VRLASGEPALSAWLGSQVPIMSKTDDIPTLTLIVRCLGDLARTDKNCLVVVRSGSLERITACARQYPPAHIGTPPTSAVGLGLPAHIGTGTGLMPSHICTGTGWARGLGLRCEPSGAAIHRAQARMPLRAARGEH